MYPSLKVPSTPTFCIKHVLYSRASTQARRSIPGARTFGLPFMATVFLRVFTRLCLPGMMWVKFSFPFCTSGRFCGWFTSGCSCVIRQHNYLSKISSRACMVFLSLCFTDILVLHRCVRPLCLRAQQLDTVLAACVYVNVQLMK